MTKIVYPKLTPHIDLGFMRLGGPGLANCMIIAARAYVLAKKNNYEYISPTWYKISLGPYLRSEKDKRHYFGLFKKYGLTGIRKLYFIILSALHNKNVIKISDLGNYFQDLKENREIVVDYFNKIINRKAPDIQNTIGIHIRLGDYKGTNSETKVDYYLNMIDVIKKTYDNKYEFILFSDARDSDLKQILNNPYVKKVFFGDALSDMLALSKCNLIIASDSTFSAMAAFLGNTPIIFPKRHFGSIFNTLDRELILNDIKNENILLDFLSNILKK
jgi:hypothetical protein